MFLWFFKRNYRNFYKSANKYAVKKHRKQICCILLDTYVIIYSNFSKALVDFEYFFLCHFSRIS